VNRILSGRIAAPGGLACALLLAACARAPVDFAADGPQVQGTTIAFAADSPQREVLGSERVALRAPVARSGQRGRNHQRFGVHTRLDIGHFLGRCHKPASASR